MRIPALSIPATFPHPIKQDEITMPRSLFYLSSSSMFVSFLLLIVSLCDLGYCSLWLTPPTSVFTLLYFAGILWLSRRERTEEDPTYFPTVIVIGYIVTTLWLVAFILTIVVFAVYPHIVEGLTYHGLHSVTVGLQRFECILCIVNLGLVAAFTARAHIIALEEGNPENWRILVEKNENLPTSRQIRIRIHHPVNFDDPSLIQEPRAAPPAPVAPPEWVTAAVLEDNMEAVRRENRENRWVGPQIEIPPPSPIEDEVYISDYYEGDSSKEHFEGDDNHHPSPQHGNEYSDADSVYETDAPDSPDQWTEESEAEEDMGPGSRHLK